MGGQGGGEDLEGLLDLHRGLTVVLGASQEGREHVDVVRPEDGVHPGRALDDAVAHLLGQAASHRDLHAGAGALDGGELAEVPEELVRGVLTHGAGVDDQHVGTLVTGVGGACEGVGDQVDGHEALGLQQARHAFGVVLVHLAAQGAHRVGAGHGLGRVLCGGLPTVRHR